jgi:hypothetical protein
MTDYIIGLDFGQTSDFTALCIVERNAEPAIYHVRHLERLPLGTPYPSVVEKVGAMWASPPLNKQAFVVADATGCGAPVVDLLRQFAPEALLYTATITSGAEARQENRRLFVPKRDLVGVMKVLLQTERLKVAKTLPFAGTLVEELLNFQVKITTAANDTYGAWREGVHDDLVFATALAGYFGETCTADIVWHDMLRSCLRHSR